MLQIARLSPRLLSDSADLVRDFVLGLQHRDGGFCDRGGQPDLYYTVFGLGCLMALQADVPHRALSTYLHSFGDGEGLDLIHLCALARGWSGLGAVPEDIKDGLRRRIDAYRTPDGGYSETPNDKLGSGYGAFLAVGAYQDLGIELAEPNRLVDTIHALQTPDGGYTNEPGLPVGTVPAVAAAESVLRSLGASASPTAADWLMQRFGNGGFYAVAAAPMPDLLSTATALHALAGMKVPFDHLVESCLDYVDSLWVNRGAFYGNWGDEVLDCEYTFYGLLALGHLSV